MTNQGPATPGTAARVRELEGWLSRICDLWTDFTSQEMYGEHIRAGMTTEDFEEWSSLHIDAITALNSRAQPAAGAPEALPEIERLKAENASLCAALAAAREVNTRLDAQWAAAEQRAEAAEKALRKAVVQIGILRDRMEGCNEMTDAQRRDQRGHELSLFEVPAWVEEHQGILDAALHDEERRPMSAEELMAEMKKAKPSTRPPLADDEERRPQQQEKALEPPSAEAAPLRDRARVHKLEIALRWLIDEIGSHCVNCDKRIEEVNVPEDCASFHYAVRQAVRFLGDEPKASASKTPPESLSETRAAAQGEEK